MPARMPSTCSRTFVARSRMRSRGPGCSGDAVEAGVTARGGALPVNPSGGLIGVGHPVGATGVRMLLDSYLQVTGQAAGYQVQGARRFGTLNIGGSTATVVCTVIEAQ